MSALCAACVARWRFQRGKRVMFTVTFANGRQVTIGERGRHLREPGFDGLFLVFRKKKA